MELDVETHLWEGRGAVVRTCMLEHLHDGRLNWTLSCAISARSALKALISRGERSESLHTGRESLGGDGKVGACTGSDTAGHASAVPGTRVAR